MCGQKNGPFIISEVTRITRSKTRLGRERGRWCAKTTRGCRYFVVCTVAYTPNLAFDLGYSVTSPHQYSDPRGSLGASLSDLKTGQINRLHETISTFSMLQQTVANDCFWCSLIGWHACAFLVGRGESNSLDRKRRSERKKSNF